MPKFMVYGKQNGQPGKWIIEGDSIESAKADMESQGYTVEGVMTAGHEPIQVFDPYEAAGGYKRWRRNLSDDCRVTMDIIFGGAILLALWWFVSAFVPTSREFRVQFIEKADHRSP